MKKRILCLFSFFILVFLFNLKGNIQANTNTSEMKLLNDAKAGVLIELNTGNVLYDQGAHERRSPASMTKIMTMHLVLDAIEEGKLKWDQIITVSEHAASMGGSQVFLETNEKMSVEDLFKALAIASGNDAAVALAEAVAGSEELFVSKMNDKVIELGLENTYFKDPTGLTDMVDGHYSSAYDMAMMGRALILKHGPTVLKYTNIYEDYIREDTDNRFWLVNTNKLIRRDDIDGLKTGWTSESGYNLTATMKQGDMRLISTVMGSTSTKVRNAETLKLLNYGYTMFEVKEYKPAGHVVGEYKSIYINPRKVNVVTKDAVHLMVKKGQPLKGYIEEYDYNLSKDKYSQGDVIGTYKVMKDGEMVYEVDLTVSEDFEKVGTLELFYRTLVKTFFG